MDVSAISTNQLRIRTCRSCRKVKRYAKIVSCPLCPPELGLISFAQVRRGTGPAPANRSAVFFNHYSSKDSEVRCRLHVLFSTSCLMDVKSQIYSMDVDHSNIEDRVRELQPGNVTYLKGDSNEIEKTFTEDFLRGLPHPWLVIEDSHTNMYGILEYFHRFMKPGDYFVVEDMNPDLPCRLGAGRIYPGEYEKAGPAGLEILKKFLTDYSKEYAVDSFYTDFFGYNGTWNWHGYICRMYRGGKRM